MKLRTNCLDGIDTRNYPSMALRKLRDVGRIYPALNREQRDVVLEKALFEFSYLGDRHVRENFTSRLGTPLFLTDISITRPNYWPDPKNGEGLELVKRYPTLKDLRSNIMRDGAFIDSAVKNEFLASYTLLRTDKCPYADEFARHIDREFLQRSLEGIVAWRFALKRGEYKIAPEVTKGRMTRLKRILPQFLHKELVSVKSGLEWADWRQFEHIP